MELRDFIVTPIIIFLVYAGAYWIRPRVTDSINRKYFIPALTVRIIGALAVGFLYQFYYDGGDTFNFHTHGSRHVWEAFMESPTAGLKLLLGNNSHAGIYEHTSKIAFFRDTQSYFIVRIASLFDLITFSSYSATAVMFGVISFAGMWLFFQTFYHQYPSQHQLLALSSLFIPSVIFWGSGLLKDTITLAALGVATYMAYGLFIQRQYYLGKTVWLFLCLYVLFKVKIYILLTFLPALILWVFLYHFKRIGSKMKKVILFPIVIILVVTIGYSAVKLASHDSPKYSVDALAKTAKITAYDIRYWTGKDAGSGYSLGELDGTWENMLTLAPQAINVSLFRPYPWEAKNILMVFSAIEALVLLILVLYLVCTNPIRITKGFGDPAIIFCLVFSIVFAFAVGISTYNFGTLVRYKIPLMPYFSVALVLLYHHLKRDKKVSELEVNE